MRTRWLILSLVVLTALGVRAGNQNTYPLPENRGAAGILAALEKLPVYVHVLQTTAHPDDESAGTLTWLSRKFHARTALFCLTRGEGGQNILGNEKYEELGLVRTGELREACKFYGADLFFGSVVDFGFSKTAEETLAKWGHDATLEEMVLFIRRFRPDVVLSRFQGSPADGHGHHQAAGLLTREAFQAAGDPARFPQQLKNGLPVWKPKKLYVSSMGGPASAGPESPGTRTVRIPVGEYNPASGMTYREIASEGYSRHRTQGSGMANSTPGTSFELFTLTESSVGFQAGEDSFFDSIDTSLYSIANLAGSEIANAPFLKQDMDNLQQFAAEALNSFQAGHPEKSAFAAARGVQALKETFGKVENSPLSEVSRTLIKEALNEKLQDFQNAVHAALGIRLIARAENLTATPGEKTSVNLYFYNQGPETVSISRADFASAQGKGLATPAAGYSPGTQIQGGGSFTATASFLPNPDASPTEPFWRLAKNFDARYKLKPTRDEFASFEESELRSKVQYQFRGTEISISADVMAQAGDPVRGSDFQELQIVPALSVTMNPKLVIVPENQTDQMREFQVSILNNLKSPAQGSLRLRTPQGWVLAPAESHFELSRRGETHTTGFRIRIPAGQKAGDHIIEAIATLGNKEFRQGYDVISYPENWTRNYYYPAQTIVERFDVRIAPNLTIGYIPGAGDDVPKSLEQLGVKIQILSAADLAYGDLQRFSAIITGIRAYNVNEDLRASNSRLLEYVSEGGTLIVQYVRPLERPGRGNSGSAFPYGPYPMSVSETDRITVEDAPVKMLDSANPVFSYPNKITDSDFQGWVQERGLYFMNSWDSHYAALLSGNDPGEGLKNGGMLYTKYGKGHYIYTAYAWFRQLPAGVPGAFRIFANMLSLGKPGATSKKR